MEQVWKKVMTQLKNENHLLINWDSLNNIHILNAYTKIHARGDPNIEVWCRILEIQTRIGILEFNQSRFPLPKVLPNNPGMVDHPEASVPSMELIRSCYEWAIRLLDEKIFEKYFTPEILAIHSLHDKTSIKKIWIYDCIRYEWGLEFEDFVRNPDISKNNEIIGMEATIARWIFDITENQ